LKIITYAEKCVAQLYLQHFYNVSVPLPKSTKISDRQQSLVPSRDPTHTPALLAIADFE
jgi:hypothetical protein